MTEDYELQEAKRIEKNLAYSSQGVKFIDIKAAYIDDGVKIGKGTVIYPCVVIEGDTEIGEDCMIGQNTRIVDSTVGDRTQIQSSVILKSRVGDDTNVGPFAYMRPDSSVGSRCKLGDFVEIKNSSMGDGSKASHLSYIGDSDVGENVNIGCGVVFVNYDGSEKHRSVVGDGAFIGCNANLVSPIEIKEKAYIAAGSTVTSDVPGGSLYVERTKAKILEGWVKRRGLLDKEKSKTVEENDEKRSIF